MTLSDIYHYILLNIHTLPFTQKIECSMSLYFCGKLTKNNQLLEKSTLLTQDLIRTLTNKYSKHQISSILHVLSILTKENEFEEELKNCLQKYIIKNTLLAEDTFLTYDTNILNRINHTYQISSLFKCELSKRSFFILEENGTAINEIIRKQEDYIIDPQITELAISFIKTCHLNNITPISVPIALTIKNFTNNGRIILPYCDKLYLSQLYPDIFNTQITSYSIPKDFIINNLLQLREITNLFFLHLFWEDLPSLNILTKMFSKDEFLSEANINKLIPLNNERFSLRYGIPRLLILMSLMSLSKKELRNSFSKETILYLSNI